MVDAGATVGPNVPDNSVCLTIEGWSEHCTDQAIALDRDDHTFFTATRSVVDGTVHVVIETWYSDPPAEGIGAYCTVRRNGQNRSVECPNPTDAYGFRIDLQVPEGASLPYSIRNAELKCSNCLARNICCDRYGTSICGGGSMNYAIDRFSPGTLSGTVFELSPSGISAEIAGTAGIIAIGNQAGEAGECDPDVAEEHPDIDFSLLVRAGF